jgi:hypothetical protein
MNNVFMPTFVPEIVVIDRDTNAPCSSGGPS